MLCGTYDAYENRRSGRKISLEIAVLPAKKKPLGDYSLVAQLAVDAQSAFRPLKIGLLASVACSGDVPRIDRTHIPGLT